MKNQLIVFISFLSIKLLACSSQPIVGKDLRSGTDFFSQSLPKHKGLVVIFLSANCPCSRSHEGSIEKLAQEFKEFSFLGVHSNKDEEPGLASVHFKEAGFSFPVIQDQNNKIANEFGALKTPHAFIIGPKGECWFNGGVDDSRDASRAKKFYLRQALAELKVGQEPKEKTSRTLGCAIRR